MQVSLVCLSVIFLLCVLNFCDCITVEDAANVTQVEKIMFDQYNQMYRKRDHSHDHRKKRQHSFTKSQRRIKEHNSRHGKGEESYTLGHHAYSDLEPEDMKTKLNGFRPGNHQHKTSKQKNHVPYHHNKTRNQNWHHKRATLPASIDWVAKGYVTKVKDQGMCGSCYSFSTTGSLEGQLFKKTKSIVELSEQNLVDCYIPGDGTGGCNGGWMDECYSLINKLGGISSGLAYPYEEQQNMCQTKEKVPNLGTVTTNYVITNDELDLQAAVATVGPIAAAVDASHYTFQLYSSGIYDNTACTQNVDHAVLVVGYGTLNGKDYWLIKNSWGPTWAEKGYMKLARNKNNLCGIASTAMYPTLS